MSNYCETWSYLKEMKLQESNFCPFAQACLGGECLIVEEKLDKKRTSLDPNRNLEKFYNQLEN